MANRYPLFRTSNVALELRSLRSTIIYSFHRYYGPFRHPPQPGLFHLREKYRDKLGLVEEFIVEIEGARKDCDITRWGPVQRHKRH